MKWQSSFKLVFVTCLPGVCAFASQPQANTVAPPAGERHSVKAVTLGKDQIIRRRRNVDTCCMSCVTILLRPVAATSSLTCQTLAHLPRSVGFRPKSHQVCDNLTRLLTNWSIVMRLASTDAAKHKSNNNVQQTSDAEVWSGIFG